ncbi:hypothetical protein NMY22_g17791 [Coprinellus aureogranulatus]|nr:hypothetical protein NMY22_g17791 [Coprinellus aureogranulatus]
MSLTTDATSRIHLTAVQVLQDDHRMKRLVAALSTGIFSYADEKAVNGIMDECSKICGGSQETLAQVLQTKFFAKHTPIYWAIVNRHSRQGVPPLLTKLLETCSPLSEETQNDVIDAFYREYHSDIYCAVKEYLTRVPTHHAFSTSLFFDMRKDRPTVTAHSLSADVNKAEIEFRLPRFLNRLLVDKQISLEFLVLERLWRLEAKLNEGKGEADVTWSFELSEVRAKCNPAASWQMKVELSNPDSCFETLLIHDNTAPPVTLFASPKGVLIDSNLKPFCLKVPDGPLLRLRCNPWTANATGSLLSDTGMLVVTFQPSIPDHGSDNRIANAHTPDLTPRIQLTSTQVLQDESRMKRLIIAFCDGLLSFADNNMATKIMEETQKICGPLSGTLSEVIQTKFFAKRTPFYWVIANRHGQKPGVPPLLTRLLYACDVLTMETQKDIVDALHREYDSELHSAVKSRLSDIQTHEPCSPSVFQGEGESPLLTAVRVSEGGKAFADFRIPRFLDRMLVDRELSLGFFAVGMEEPPNPFSGSLADDSPQIENGA